MDELLNTKYPNIPETFREEMTKARIEQGWTQAAVSSILKLSGPSAVSQFELGRRSMTYDRAVQFRDLYEMDFDLPLPDFSHAVKIKRNRKRHYLIRDYFYAEIDGRLIKVMTYYDMGPMTRGNRLEEH
jgi:transcriptional regulator with XRE-family HTH domain